MAIAEPLPGVAPVLKFEVTAPTLDNEHLGFFTQVTGFGSQVDVLEYPEGGRNGYVHRLPGRIKQGNLTLKRGVTDRQKMLAWLDKVAVSVEPTELRVDLYDAKGNRLSTWSFDNAWPIKWSGSDLNAGGTEFLTETLEIAHSGMTVT
jgi:phage tail-like protein